ncbi:hypothetical protein C1I98_04350 [Spongiactinospora gelatinilytica]|uniref:Uncharacterized protein n=1 Tax=Spongiactinospora gelatinilytica TaxID=2666298 RepID=A0A2W2HX00_9ACTN|nr:hypothetical protein C1I98_04350 [Spongiactinospora gelatinilytica]
MRIRWRLSVADVTIAAMSITGSLAEGSFAAKAGMWARRGAETPSEGSARSLLGDGESAAVDE